MSNEQALRKQKIHLVVTVCIVGAIAFGIGKYAFNKCHSPNYKLFEPKVDLPVDDFKSKEVWMDRLESQISFLSQKQNYYEETLLEYKEREQANEKEKLELKKQLATLKQEIEESKIAQAEAKEEISLLPPQEFYAPVPPNPPLVSNPPFYSNIPLEPLPLRPPLCEYVILEEQNAVFPVSKRTPANVSVRAILISSVDAVCRLDAQSDPVPVKLRLLDDGYLPEGVVVKLKGCLIGASAYGDISNERVYMRLENLTKVNAKGEAIETEVTGYVSGEDGRFGLRGVVVDRTAKILKNAAGSGVLSGIAQTLQAACTRPANESYNTSIGADFAQSTASGASDAFSMLAAYYIKRAEQVQPVLQINAGRIVDITFTHGFSMGDIHAKVNLKKIRERSRGS
jgi:conjugal transfer pilus assembly protein TraB